VIEMVLVRWDNPLQWVREVERDMATLTRRLFGSDSSPALPSAGDAPAALGSWDPAVDVISRGDDLVVRVELPGVDPQKDVEVGFHDGALTIKGQRRHVERTEGERYIRLESSYGAFQRMIPLPEGVRADDITATYADGVLEIVVPKAAQLASPAGRSIPIRTPASQVPEREAEAGQLAEGGAGT